MHIRIAGSVRPVAVKALEHLVSEDDADHLLAPAKSLLSTLQSGDVSVDTASMKGEALATALEDLLDSGSLSASDEDVANELLDKF